MLARFKNQSLHRQLVVPIIVVGVLSVLAVAFSASRLNQSVEELEKVYEVSDRNLKTVGELEVGVSHLRALSLRHVASESYRSMVDIGEEYRDAVDFILTRTTLLVNAEALTGEEAELINQELSPALQQYMKKVKKVVNLSADFEKESAFVLLSNANAEHLPVITDTLQKLKNSSVQSIVSLRTAVADDAEENVSLTIVMGIFGVSMMAVIAYVVIRRTTRRIGNILEWSEEFAEGNMGVPLTVDSDDEVGRLTGSMRHMGASIKKAHDALAGAKSRAEMIADELQLYEQAFASSGEAMLITDADNRIVNVNDAFTAQTGYTLEEVRGENPKLLSCGKTPPNVYQEMWQGLEENDFWQGELWDRKKDGEIYPKWISITVLRDEDGKPQFYTASFTDISERKESEARIEHLAHHDILTGLLNRFSMEERLEQAIATAIRTRNNIALLFIDLDRFKTINDSLGHHMGDSLLTQVAQRLKACVRGSDIVARIGGDEFVIVLNGIRLSAHAASVAENILKEVSHPYDLDGQTVNTSPSIGISIFPDDGTCVDDLMRTADIAMYNAKEAGKNNYQYFDKKMLVEASRRIGIEKELRDALQNESGGLLLRYQPQVRADDSSVFAAEALVRWDHPQDGIVPPSEFIPVAEDTGLIHEVGRWVINESCRQLAEWKREGLTTCKVAINVSAKQLQSATLVSELDEIMQAHGVSGSELELEVTETVAMSDPEHAINQLYGIRDLGISVAIDDFGTGYSSLAYLKRLPINILKLDRSLVSDIEMDINDAEICRATVALAHTLGLKVIAEGVETEAQRSYLREIGCDYLQGYLFDKPLPASEMSLLLQLRAR